MKRKTRNIIKIVIVVFMILAMVVSILPIVF